MTFTVTSNQIMYVGMIVGIVILSLIILKITLPIMKTMLLVRENNKKYKEKMKKVEQMKANGEFHQWMKMKLRDKTLYVCEKTGYCPEMDGFMSQLYISKYKQAKKFDEYKERKYNELCDKYNLNSEQLKTLINELSDIPKEYLKFLLVNIKSEEESEKEDAKLQ